MSDTCPNATPWDVFGEHSYYNETLSNIYQSQVEVHHMLSR